MTNMDKPFHPQSADRDPQTGQFTIGNKIGHRFQPGESGNPGGNRTAGAWVAEHLNALVSACERGNLTAQDITRIRNDESESWARRTAAKLLLNALSEDEQAQGKLDPGKDLDRIMDRTQGRAVQRAEVHIDTPRAPDDLLAEARRAAGLEVIGGEG
jgi:hypothetical protein